MNSWGRSCIASVAITTGCTSMASEHPAASGRVAGETASVERWTGPMFIVGMPRSGTKLLRGLLAQHPRVRISDAETDFLPFLARWVERHGPPDTELAFARLYAQMSNATYFNFRSAQREPFAWERWREACNGRFHAGGLFEGFLRYELGVSRDSSIVWADKSPAYIRHIPLLLEQFPAARIVHLVRDVRDYCVSIRRAWNKDTRRAAWQWGRDVLAAHRFCQATPRHCIELKYEDLLLDPQLQLRRLSLFLDLEYLPATAELWRNVENYGDAAGHAHIVRDNVGKFETRMTAREIEAIESLAFDAMRELGYEAQYAKRQRRLGALAQRWLQLKDAMHLVRRTAHRRGFLSALRFHTAHRRMAD